MEHPARKIIPFEDLFEYNELAESFTANLPILIEDTYFFPGETVPRDTMVGRFVLENFLNTNALIEISDGIFKFVSIHPVV